MSWLRRHFLSVDPRTLGFFRIALAALLLFDLAKRIPGADLKVTLKTLNAMETGLNRQDARAGSRV